MFDVGSGRYPAPPVGDDAQRKADWLADLARVRDVARSKAETARDTGDRTHTEVQRWLRNLGRALGYDVHIAATIVAENAVRAGSATGASQEPFVLPTPCG